MRVYNTLDGPLVIDEVGHTVGGHEHADATDSPMVRAHIDAGRLVAEQQPAQPKTTPAAPKPKTATTEEG